MPYGCGALSGGPWEAWSDSCGDGRDCCVEVTCVLNRTSIGRQDPACTASSVVDSVTFDSRGDLEAFFRGEWLQCGGSGFIGPTIAEGLSFQGAGESFGVRPLTRPLGGGDCIFVNADTRNISIEGLEVNLADPGAKRWNVSFELSHEPRSIVAIASSPKRMRLAEGVVLMQLPALTP